ETLFAQLASVGDTPRLRHRRALMLSIFSQAYLTLGELGEARQRADTSVARLLDLAREFPDQAAYQRDLAVSQERLGQVLRARGDSDGALAAYRAALAIVEKRAGLDSSDIDLQRNLAGFQDRIGDVLQAQG